MVLLFYLGLRWYYVTSHLSLCKPHAGSEPLLTWQAFDHCRSDSPAFSSSLSSFHMPVLAGAAGVRAADGCLAFTSHLRDWKKQHNLRPATPHRLNETGKRCEGAAQILNNPFESPLPPAWTFKVCPMFYLSDAGRK